jgi:poly(3-hydroxybutyrate) depolymerase
LIAHPLIWIRDKSNLLASVRRLIVLNVTLQTGWRLVWFGFIASVVLAGLGPCFGAGPPTSRNGQAQTDKTSAAGAAIEIREGLALEVPNRDRRAIIGVDPVAAQLVAGTWTMPRAGDVVTFAPSQTRRWQLVKAGNDGSFSRGAIDGYMASTINSDNHRVMILEASGHAMAYVNSEPRAGDVYETGYVKIPVRLRKGPSVLLFQASGLKARLTVPAASALLNTGDLTAPDLIAGEPTNAVAAVVVVNATESWRDDLAIVTVIPDGPETRTPVPPLAPLSIRKVVFEIKGPPPPSNETCATQLRLQTQSRAQPTDTWQTLDTASISLRVRKDGQTHKRTFRSAIDGSVQYYAVVPALRDAPETGRDRPGLVLTLHGAAVEAIGQAEAYAPKAGLQIVAPTNRRPYGFDWEDWGRLDAIEVLDLAQNVLKTDPRRTYLTGHSMGGHGTWHLGVNFPDRFAAIAPSAGWISMWSYAGARRVESPRPLEALLARASAPSDTLGLARNLSAVGVYVLHGDADDNVPVSQARRMRQVLGEFHPDFAYHEQTGAGHWWGNACVDWPPLFAFLDRRTLPAPGDVRRVDFITASPGVSHRVHWVSIEAQSKSFTPSAVHIAFEPERRRFCGTTENVARLVIDVGQVLHDGKDQAPITIELDGQTVTALAPPLVATAIGDRRVHLVRSADTWAAAPAPAPLSRKGPHRMGPFKEAFRNRFVFIVGTKGTEEENAVMLARARFDSENFWYRGNGSVDILIDNVFIDSTRAEEFRERNVVLYGHAGSNAAWAPLLADSPVQVERGRVRIGKRTISGDNLACLFLRPRPGSETATVGVVAGSGVAGMKLTTRLPYFTSGVAYPDCLLLDARSLNEGPAGFLAAGYFGPDWDVESGEFAWRD